MNLSCKLPWKDLGLYLKPRFFCTYRSEVKLRGLSIFVFTSLFALLGGQAAAQGKINSSPFSGLAIHGYDPVAYFEQSQAVPGDREIRHQWNGVEFAFASHENRELFKQNPKRFLPQYGGYCAYAAAHNAVSDVDPIAWQIVEGKLYLNYDHKVQRLWANQLDEFIPLADQHWNSLQQTLE